MSAAFAAPIGGLLFVFEEVASFWEKRLTWMIFFSCMVATFVVEWFGAMFERWTPSGNFDVINLESVSMFSERKPTLIPMNILLLPPAGLVGIVGGVFGTLFTWINIKVCRKRARYIMHQKVVCPNSAVRCSIIHSLSVEVCFDALFCS